MPTLPVMEDCAPEATDDPVGAMGEGLEKEDTGITATGLDTIPGRAEEVLGPTELDPIGVSAEATAGGA